MTKKALVFLDWGGTLSDMKFWHASPSILEHAQRQLFGEDKKRVDDWMRGVHSSEDICEWLSGFAQTYASNIFRELKASCEQMSLSQEAIEHIRKLKQKAHVVLATDNMDCFRRFTIPAQNLLSIFDDILDSSSLGRMKKDEGGRTFIEYAQLHAFSPEATYLIDDSQGTCELFRSLGGTAIQTHGKVETVAHLQAMKTTLLLD